MAVGDTTRHGTVLFEARGRMDTAGKWSILAVVLGCLLVIPYALARNEDGDPTQTLLIVGLTYLVVIVTLVLTIVHLRSRIQVTPTHLIKTRVPLPAQVVARSEVVEAVVTRDYAVARLGGPRAILLDRTGEALMHTHPVRELADVEALAQVAPQVTHLAVLRPQEVRERWPRMLPWSHADPKAGVLLGVGIVFAVVLVGVVAAVILG